MDKNILGVPLLNVDHNIVIGMLFLLSYVDTMHQSMYVPYTPLDSGLVRSISVAGLGQQLDVYLLSKTVYPVVTHTNIIGGR